MEINILIGGDSGQGVNLFANILCEAIAHSGFYAFNYRDYKSLIAGGHTFHHINISDQEIKSHTTKPDITIALNKEAVDMYKKKSKIFLHSQKDCKEGICLEVEEFPLKARTMVFAGAIMNILGLSDKKMHELLKEKFFGSSLYQPDVNAFNKGFKAKYSYSKKITTKSKKINSYILGVDPIGIGSIEAGLDLYIGYPMTPSTTLLHFLAKYQNKYNYTVVEPENEIAGVNSALGSSYAGANTMIGTAGGGYDLMTEGISMQGIAEIPLVCHLAQRPGPGSGVPTYQAQGDLDVAVYGGHGSFPRVVVAPGDMQQGFDLTKQCFYLSRKLDLLTILLTDKHILESGYTVDKLHPFKTPKLPKRQIPGKKIFRKSSYETDEQGFTVEDTHLVEDAMKKRVAKYDLVLKEMEHFETFKKYSSKKNEKLILFWGSTKGVMDDSLNKNVDGIQIIYLHPFSKSLVKELKKYKQENIYVVEQNTHSQMADLVAKNTGLVIPKKNMLLKYDARPFSREEVQIWLSKI